MTATTETLRRLSFFADLSEDSQRNIARVLQRRRFTPGQVILLEGEPCHSVYFVAEGLVRVRRMSLEGREHVLAYLGPGQALNLVQAVDGGVSLATVDATTEVSVFVMPCLKFRQIIRVDHGIADASQRELAAEVRRLSDMVEDLALHTVRTRLARFLLARVADEEPRRQWTQEEIASHIGTVREMVGRSLRAFVSAGIIQRQRGRVVVQDHQALEQIATGE